MRMAALVLVIVLTAPYAARAAEVRSVALQGIERHYWLHNAEAAAAAPVPVVVHLHGLRGEDEAIAGRSDYGEHEWSPLDSAASAEGFAVVYPTAYRGQWSMFDGLSRAALEDGTPIDDVGFIFAAVEQVADAGIADLDRVYLSGISDGAIMAYRLLCQPASPFAAAVPLVGTMAEAHRDACAAAYVPPIMVIAGTNDRILPYDGWLFPTGRELSVPETLEHWRRLHGCDGQDARFLDDREPADDSRVLEVTWTGCARDGAVKLLRVEGGGHSVPRFRPVSDEWRQRSGGHNQDIESAEEVWRFVSQFRRSDAE